MMTTFDKACAVLSLVAGALFMVQGALGLFLGASANFTLSPGWGVLPFFVGWGMCVSLIKCWKSARDGAEDPSDAQ